MIPTTTNEFSINFYYPLASEEITTPVFSTKMTTQQPQIKLETREATLYNNHYHVDVIDLNRLNNLIVEQQQHDGAGVGETSMPTQSMQENISIHVYRTEIKRKYNLRTLEKINEAFKRFFIAFKHADIHAAIRPYYSDDAK